MNKAAVNICMQTFVWTDVSLVKVLEQWADTIRMVSEKFESGSPGQAGLPGRGVMRWCRRQFGQETRWFRKVLTERLEPESLTAGHPKGDKEAGRTRKQGTRVWSQE